MTPLELLTELYKGRAKSVKNQGDSSRPVDRTYEGRAKSVKKIKVTAQEVLTERIRGEQNL